jgi:tripartite-type tricarboxylate transporter receptor subunit TctC
MGYGYVHFSTPTEFGRSICTALEHEWLHRTGEFPQVSRLVGQMKLAGASTQSTTAYPTKLVSIVVAYTPGGQGDTIARLISDKLATTYKQAVVVNNKPGVSGTVGTRLVVQAKNDGYTLLLGQLGEMVVKRLLIKDLGYDPVKDMVPVVLIGNPPLVMLAPLDAPNNMVSEFIQLARPKPGEVSDLSVGAGTPDHESAVALGPGTQLNMIHVPNGASEFTCCVRTESLKYEKLINNANIKLEQ